MESLDKHHHSFYNTRRLMALFCPASFLLSTADNMDGAVCVLSLSWQRVGGGHLNASGL